MLAKLLHEVSASCFVEKMKMILGKKIGMTQVFTQEGNTVPVTLIQAGPCKVLQVKTKETDGYQAVQLGFEPLPQRKVGKSLRDKGFRFIREFPVLDAQPNVGDEINATAFQEGDIIDVSGISKGKGFAGGVKRWGFSGRNATRGTKHEHRTIGSVGAARPARVRKGKHMPGHLGADRVTVKNLKIVKIDAEKNLVAIGGAVPGRRGTLLEIRTKY